MPLIIHQDITDQGFFKLAIFPDDSQIQITYSDPKLAYELNEKLGRIDGPYQFSIKSDTLIITGKPIDHALGIIVSKLCDNNYLSPENLATLKDIISKNAQEQISKRKELEKERAGKVLTEKKQRLKTTFKNSFSKLETIDGFLPDITEFLKTFLNDERLVESLEDFGAYINSNKPLADILEIISLENLQKIIIIKQLIAYGFIDTEDDNLSKGCKIIKEFVTLIDDSTIQKTLAFENISREPQSIIHQTFLANTKDLIQAGKKLADLKELNRRLILQDTTDEELKQNLEIFQESVEALHENLGRKIVSLANLANNVSPIQKKIRDLGSIAKNTSVLIETLTNPNPKITKEIKQAKIVEYSTITPSLSPDDDIKNDVATVGGAALFCLGGVIIGAAIGTLILPGAGTAVGGVIGGTVGGLVGAGSFSAIIKKLSPSEISTKITDVSIQAKEFLSKKLSLIKLETTSSKNPTTEKIQTILSAASKGKEEVKDSERTLVVLLNERVNLSDAQEIFSKQREQELQNILNNKAEYQQTAEKIGIIIKNFWQSFTEENMYYINKVWLSHREIAVHLPLDCRLHLLQKIPDDENGKNMFKQGIPQIIATDKKTKIGDASFLIFNNYLSSYNIAGKKFFDFAAANLDTEQKIQFHQDTVNLLKAVSGNLEEFCEEYTDFNRLHDECLKTQKESNTCDNPAISPGR